MGQLVREQTLARFGVGTVLVGPEHEMWSDGERQGPHGLGRLRGWPVGMHSNGAEILLEPLFHRGAHGWLEGPPGAGERLMHRSGDLVAGTAVGGLATTRRTGPPLAPPKDSG